MLAVLPAAHLTKSIALEVAQAQGLQDTPLPKYPSLQVHVDVSVVVLPGQEAAFVAYGEHVLHAEQFEPLP